MTISLEDLSHQLLDAAKRAGAETADAIVVQGQSLSIEVRNGDLEQAERAEGIDLGLRVLIGQKQASVSSSDTAPQTIATLAERAVFMAREAPDEPYCGLADVSQLSSHRDASGLDLLDDASEPEASALQELALRAEASALAVQDVSKMDNAGAAWSKMRFHHAATNGFSGGYGRTSLSVQAVAISGDGLEMERDYAYDQRIHRSDLDSPEEIGRLAGERAVASRGARKPPTGAFPVLYDERVASGLIGHLLQAINGGAIARGSSWLIDAMGEAVLPKGIDLIEYPHRPRVSGSRRFDGEGLPTAQRDIVCDGILQGWTLDLATARKLGLQSTANATRGVTSPPSPATGNVTLTQGTSSREDLLAQMGTGLLVTSLIGSTINPTTGDYSRGASGFWVENGEIRQPVNECTIAGNLRDMLRRIVPADDARPHLSRVVPSLLVEGLTIAGS